MTIKNKLEQQLDARLEQWKTEINKAETEARASAAKADAERADAETRDALYERLNGLRKRVKDGEQQLSRLKDATEAQVASIKDDIMRLVA